MKMHTPAPTTAMIRRVLGVKRSKMGRGWMIYCCHMLLLLQIVGVSGTGQQWLFLENRFMSNLGSNYSSSSADWSLCALLCAQDPACVGFTVDPCVLYAELVHRCAARDAAEPPGFLKYITNGGNLGWPIGLTCPASFEFSAVTGSCYLYQDTTKASVWSELKQQCENQGAHLLAVNNKEEHDWIRSYMTANHGVCQTLVTGGTANVPGSSMSLTDWSWGLCDGTKQQATYFDWCSGEPNGSNQNVIGLVGVTGFNYEFIDNGEDVSGAGWYGFDNMCFICEISA